jgi:hypothetical protein
MEASDKPVPAGKSHQWQLHAAYEGSVAEGFPGDVPLGVDRLYLMVTAVFDRLTESDDKVSGAGV